MRLVSPAALLLLSTAIDASSSTVYTAQTISLSRSNRDQSNQFKIRGGASTAALSEDEYDEEAYDEEYDEYDEEEELDAKLSKATEAALEKGRKKKAEESKKAMAAAKKKTAAKKKRKSVFKLLRVPYIVRAMLNPFTVFAMTQKYFASLFNVNYLEDVSSSAYKNLKTINFDACCVRILFLKNCMSIAHNNAKLITFD